MSYSGALPLASEFAGYEKAAPGAGNRLISLAENNQESRLRIREANSAAMLTGFKLSVLLPWVFIVVFMVATLFLVGVGHPGFGAVSGLVTLLSAAPKIKIEIENAFNRNTGAKADS